MTETKCFRDAFRDQLHELRGQPNTLEYDYNPIGMKSQTGSNHKLYLQCLRHCKKWYRMAIILLPREETSLHNVIGEYFLYSVLLFIKVILLIN